jgi:hypothetical protein
MQTLKAVICPYAQAPAVPRPANQAYITKMQKVSIGQPTRYVSSFVTRRLPMQSQACPVCGSDSTPVLANGLAQVRDGKVAGPPIAYRCTRGHVFLAAQEDQPQQDH